MVRAGLPDVEADDLDIRVSGTTLVISGEKKTRSRRKGYLHHTESRFGSLSRSLTLGEGVDTERVEADYENGVLTVRLPKTKATTPKRIEVRTL